jgi:hypothetical protein
MRVADILKMEARRTPIAVRCEMNPSAHMITAEYVMIVVDAVGSNSLGEPSQVKLTLRVCNECMADFIYSGTAVLKAAKLPQHG